jgi:catechol 2,3-dioxygenase-like lactoylglutathione lyase family enzyme
MKATSSATVLHVSSLEISLLYYTTVLGFQHAFTFGDYAGVCSGETTIHLCGPKNQGIKKTIGQGHLCIDVSHIDPYYKSLTEKKVELTYPIGDRPYGMRDFAIVDPDGNTLVFGQPIGEH